MKNNDIVTLEKVPVGGMGEIDSIVADCDRAGRLSILGFVPGRRVLVKRLAPLGDPMSVEIDGQVISLRKAEAKIVAVKRCLA